MKNSELIAIEEVKYLGKQINFFYWENNEKVEYTGYVKSFVIEDDHNNSLCIRFDNESYEYFEVKNIFKAKLLNE